MAGVIFLSLGNLKRAASALLSTFFWDGLLQIFYCEVRTKDVQIQGFFSRWKFAQLRLFHLCILELTVWVGHQVIFECWVTWTHHPKELPGNPQKMCFLYNQSAGTVKNASENLPCNFFERILPPIVFYRQKWETWSKFLQCRHIVSLFFAGFFRNPGSVNPRFASVKLPSHGGIESSQKSNPLGSSTSLQVAPVAGVSSSTNFSHSIRWSRWPKGRSPQSPPPAGWTQIHRNFWFQKHDPKVEMVRRICLKHVSEFRPNKN